MTNVVIEGLGEFADVHSFSDPLPTGLKPILTTLVGSTIHGTSVAETDDIDVMSIGVEPLELAVGLHRFETNVLRTKAEGERSGPGDLDMVTHSLTKWARLAAKGNPTILIPLFATPISVNTYGEFLRRNRFAFVTKNAGRSFLGFASDQLKRLRGEIGQKRVTRAELVEKYGYDTKYAGHVVRLTLQGIELMTEAKLSLPMQKKDADTVVDVRRGKCSLEQVNEMVEHLIATLKRSIENSALPDKADEPMISRMVAAIYSKVWEENDQTKKTDRR